MTTKRVADKNTEAPHINPEHSGIRSGNPQLDPDSARKDKTPTGKRPGEPHHDRK